MWNLYVEGAIAKMRIFIIQASQAKCIAILKRILERVLCSFKLQTFSEKIFWSADLRDPPPIYGPEGQHVCQIGF